jgi:hypothetical protein
VKEYENSCFVLSRLNVDDIEEMGRKLITVLAQAGLRQITTHALLCIIAIPLVTLAGLRLKRLEKARPLTLLGT